MSSTSSTRGPARETRLLLLTLGVSVAVLFVLARFRFPERPISELATPQPLTRLARATTFEDLSATLGDLLRRGADAQVPLRVGDADGNTRLVPGLRIRDDLAIAVVSGNQHVDGNATPVVARDEVRGLVLVRVPAQQVPSLPIQPPTESLEMPGFLVFIDAAPGGPSVRAEFVSQATPQPHPAWDAPLLALGGIANPRPGSLVFSLAGRFVGMVLADDDGTLVAPGEALIARADRLTHGESILAANAGLTVQPLSSALAKATRADHGVIVAAINNGSASLRVGDVIQAMDRDDIRSVNDWERVLSHRAPGTTVTLQIARRDGTTQVPLTLMWRDASMTLAVGGSATGDGTAGAAKAGKAGAANASAGHVGNAAKSGAAAFGLRLRALATRDAVSDGAKRGRSASGGGGADGGAGALEVMRVDAGSAAARAGLRVGDRLVALPAAGAAGAAAARAGDKAANPAVARGRGTAASSASSTATPATPMTLARVDAAFDALAAGDALLLSISRVGQPLLMAVEKAAVEKP